MILISNNSDFDNEIFPKLKNRKIQINKIVFKPYTPLELFNIMKKKLEDIKMQNCFSDDSIRFLATKLNKSGDLRPKSPQSPAIRPFKIHAIVIIGLFVSSLSLFLKRISSTDGSGPVCISACPRPLASAPAAFSRFLPRPRACRRTRRPASRTW